MNVQLSQPVMLSLVQEQILPSEKIRRLPLEMTNPEFSMIDIDELGHIAAGFSMRFLVLIATCIICGDPVPKWCEAVGLAALRDFAEKSKIDQ